MWMVMSYFQYLIEKCLANIRKLSITAFLQKMTWSSAEKWVTITFLKTFAELRS